VKNIGPKWEEVVGGWKRLHNDDIQYLYISLNIVRVKKSWKISWVGHVARGGYMAKTYKILVGNSEGKRPLGRPRCR
jgi:hypothetical protein